VGSWTGGNAARLLLPKSTGVSSPMFKSAKKLAGTTLRSVANVWDALETAGDQLADTSRKNAVHVVAHHYGPRAGQMADDSIELSANAVKTFLVIDSFGTKDIAKKALRKGATATAKGALKEAMMKDELATESSVSEATASTDDSLSPSSSAM